MQQFCRFLVLGTLTRRRTCGFRVLTSDFQALVRLQRRGIQQCVPRVVHSLVIIDFITASAVAWGALGPHMFSGQSLYRVVPISLAIGLFLPIPFYIAVGVLAH